MPTSEEIKCHTVMAGIGGWATHKACGAWRGEFIGLMANILGHLIFIVWGVGARVVTLIRWEENSWSEWLSELNVLLGC